jgi:hypothetical protein
MMTLRRFRALTQSYGAELQRWPHEERGAAEELLRSSDEARALLEQERSLDEVIVAVSAREDSQRWPHGAEEAALARLRSGVANRIAAEEARAWSHRARGRPAEGLLRGLLGWLSGGGQEIAPLRRRRLGLATSGALAIVAGLAVGGMYSPAPPPAGGVLTALLQPATLEILAD